MNAMNACALELQLCKLGCCIQYANYGPWYPQLWIPRPKSPRFHTQAWDKQYKWSCTCDMCLYFLLRWSSVWQWFGLYLPMSLRPWTPLWWKYGGMSWGLWWWKQDCKLVERYMDWPWMSVWWVITPSKNLYHRALSLKKTNPQHKKLQDCGYNIEVG